jgi:hypothetical protein
MYLGYMKKGLQSMVMFAAAGFLGGVSLDIRFEWIAILFFLIMPLMWFYQMFDAMHSLTRMKREEIENPSDDGFFFPQKLFIITPIKNRSIAKGAAVVLILLGVIGIINGVLNNLHYAIGWGAAKQVIDAARNYMVPTIVSVVLIFVGVKLLKGSKKE